MEKDYTYPALEGVGKVEVRGSYGKEKVRFCWPINSVGSLLMSP